MELLGIDFIILFPKIGGDSRRWIIIAIDYFSRFIWTEATERSHSQTVIDFLKTSIFDKFGVPVGMYMDPGPHFGEKTRKFAESNGVVWCNSPVAAKKAVGMIEKSVDILQRVLKKMLSKTSEWPEMVPAVTLEVNRREIPHLLYSPSQILFGFNLVSALEIKFPLGERRSLAAGLASCYGTIFLGESEHSEQVINHILKHIEIQREALERPDLMKVKAAERYNLGIRGNCCHG